MRHDIIDPIINHLLQNGVNRLSDYFRHCPSVIEHEVSRTPDQTVAGKNEEDWVKELVDKYSLPIIEILSGPSRETKKERVMVANFGRSPQIDMFHVHIEFQMMHDEKMESAFRLKPNSYDSQLPGPTYHNGKFTFKIPAGTTDDLQKSFFQTQLKQKVDMAVEGYKKEFAKRNEDSMKGKKELEHWAREHVKKRISELERSAKATDILDLLIEIPLKKKSEKIEVIALTPKINKPAPGTPSAESKSHETQLYLPPESFKLFLGYIDRYMKTCERTPLAFLNLEEEHIRDLMLPYLNQVFEGATGETFSKYGKSDIYLVISKGGVLICELKWWSGQTSLYKVINQVLDRLTWRENYGVVMIFVRAADIDAIVKKSVDMIKAYPNNNSSVEVLAQHHLKSKCKRTNGSGEVEMHYLFYHFPERALSK